MSLKAGRVGVNPADVDPINGHISPDSVNSYTKAQADAKFETQTHAASTYETKSEAETAHALLQPKTLAIPLHMLDGSKLTVETALHGLNNGKVDRDRANASFTDVVGTIQDTSNIRKQGSVVDVIFNVNGVTANANTVLGVIPSGSRPYSVNTPCIIMSSKTEDVYRGYLSTDGKIYCVHALTDDNIRMHVTYVV